MSTVTSRTTRAVRAQAQLNQRANESDNASRVPAGGTGGAGTPGAGEAGGPGGGPGGPGGPNGPGGPDGPGGPGGQSPPLEIDPPPNVHSYVVRNNDDVSVDGGLDWSVVSDQGSFAILGSPSSLRLSLTSAGSERSGSASSQSQCGSEFTTIPFSLAVEGRMHINAMVHDIILNTEPKIKTRRNSHVST
jgi:hypothetical protein